MVLIVGIARGVNVSYVATTRPRTMRSLSLAPTLSLTEPRPKPKPKPIYTGESSESGESGKEVILAGDVAVSAGATLTFV